LERQWGITQERSISEDFGARKGRMGDLADDGIETRMRSEQSSETAGGMTKNKLLPKQGRANAWKIEDLLRDQNEMRMRHVGI
jgi:hypothetical protein